MSSSFIEALIASLPPSVQKFGFMPMPNQDLEHMLILLLNCSVWHVEAYYNNDYPYTEVILDSFSMPISNLRVKDRDAYSNGTSKFLTITGFLICDGSTTDLIRF